MCFNIGVIIGPIFGGLLADPVGNYPGVFGPGSVIGGADGVWWMEHWPYALPNVLSGIFIIVAGIAVTLGLDEVSFIYLNIPTPACTNLNQRPTKSPNIGKTGAGTYGERL